MGVGKKRQRRWRNPRRFAQGAISKARIGRVGFFVQGGSIECDPDPGLDIGAIVVAFGNDGVGVKLALAFASELFLGHGKNGLSAGFVHVWLMDFGGVAVDLPALGVFAPGGDPFESGFEGGRVFGLFDGFGKSGVEFIRYIVRGAMPDADEFAEAGVEGGFGFEELGGEFAVVGMGEGDDGHISNVEFGMQSAEWERGNISRGDAEALRGKWGQWMRVRWRSSRFVSRYWKEI